MTDSYAFVAQLERLDRAKRAFESQISLLNLIIVAGIAYASFSLIGITLYFRFYWQDTLLAEVPALLALALGLVGSRLLARRRRLDVLHLLGGDLMEMAQAAYDNRASRTMVMDRLAEEVRGGLSSVKPKDILDSKELFRRLVGVALLVVIVISISLGDLGGEITPSDLQIFDKMRDDAISLFGDDEMQDKGSEGQGSSSIYGTPSLAVLQESKLEMELYPGMGIGSRAIETAPVEHLFSSSPPGQGVAVSTELYIESLPPQHREIVKKYFQILAKD
ncbi:MAG: hypothetical protein JW986_10785 [Methanotrichaceae archaeon]|nr:hypothetical protein [Methanotrichaceae archaeon]